MMPKSGPYPGQPLQTISKGGAAPSSRVKDPQSAAEIVEHLYQANASRRVRWAQVERMFDGVPPFNQQLLINNGQAHRSNFNPMNGKAILSNASTTYYDLFNASKTFFDIKLMLDDKDRSMELSRALTLAVDKRLKQWPNFFFRMWSLINDYVRHGRAFLFWNDDWKFRNVRQHRVMVPDGTEIDTELVDLMVVVQDVPATWLWKRVRDEGTASMRGWNRGAVIEAIRTAMPDDKRSSDDAVDVQESLRDNDMWIDTLANRVSLANVYVKEFDGQWSHYIIHRRQGSRSAPRTRLEYLYKNRNRFKKLEQFCTPFFFEVMDGSWNGASGLGKDIYPLIQHQDRILNAMMDAVYLRTGVNLQANDASSLRRLSNVQIGGGMNVFPPGFNALNSTILGDLDGAITIDRHISSALERNTGIYRPRIESEKGNPATATEMEIRFAQATVLSNSAVDRWYVQEDVMAAEMWRRMKDDTPLIREIRREIDATQKEINAEAVVTASRAMGNGSQAARQRAVQGVGQLVGSLPEAGRQNWIDDAIAVQAGHSKVQRYNPKPPERDTPDQQTWEAMNENADLAAGAPVVRYPKQNDFVHAQTHLQFMAQTAQMLQNGAPPERVYSVLTNVGPHMQLHLMALEGDDARKESVKALQEQANQLAKLADDLATMIERQQKQQAQQAQEQAAQQPGMDPAMMIDMRERAAKLGLERDTQAAKLALEREKTQADIENQRAKTQADVEARRAQAAAQRTEDLANLER